MTVLLSYVPKTLTFRRVPSSSPSCDYRRESWRFKTNARVSFSARPISSGSANVTKFERFRHLHAPHSVWLACAAGIDRLYWRHRWPTALLLLDFPRLHLPSLKAQLSDQFVPSLHGAPYSLRNTSSLLKSSNDHLLNSVLTCDRFQISGCHLIDNRPVRGFS
jgi:hypothetical protein